jgi:hypothetical protein
MSSSEVGLGWLEVDVDVDGSSRKAKMYEEYPLFAD